MYKPHNRVFALWNLTSDFLQIPHWKIKMPERTARTDCQKKSVPAHEDKNTEKGGNPLDYKISIHLNSIICRKKWKLPGHEPACAWTCPGMSCLRINLHAPEPARAQICQTQSAKQSNLPTFRKNLKINGVVI